MNKNYLNEDLSELFEDIVESSDNEDLESLFEDIHDEEVDEVVEEVEQPEAKEIEVEVVKKPVDKKVAKKLMRESSDTEKFIRSYLIEDCQLSESYVETLLEDEKTQNVAAVIMELFNNIKDKLSGVDTMSADKSRGDIKSLKELPYIQDAVTKLEKLIENDSNYFPELAEYIERIIKSILYLNQYSSDFKDAYRNKKTLIILKYQSLILSVISSLSYLISAAIDFKASEPALKKDIYIEEIAPLKTLKQFNESVSSGEFRLIVRDVNVMREYYCEIPVETMTNLLEAGDTLNMVIDGVKNMASQITNGKVTNLIYKLSGVVVLLFSLRDIFYTLFRAKTKISDMINNIQLFAGELLGSQFSKLFQFNNKMRADLESATDLAKRDLEDENREIATAIKSKSLLNKPVEYTEPTQAEQPVQASGDSFFFDF